MTVSARWGISTVIPCRLFCRALTMRMTDIERRIVGSGKVREADLDRGSGLGPVPGETGEIPRSAWDGRGATRLLRPLPSLYLSPLMSRLLTPKFLLRGFEFSV